MDVIGFRRKGGNMKIKLIIFAITALPLIANTAIASDFYGASVTDKDVPSSYMKNGIYGSRPIINDVTYDSPAERAGFSKGDIILSINDKDVKRSSDLDNISGNTLKVNIFNGFKWKTLTIDRLAIETEKASRIATERKAATVTTHQSPYVNERPDNSPPLKFDDKALEKKYGKTTPAELAGERQTAEAALSAEDAEEKRIKLEEKQRLDAEKLAKTDCTGEIPGECGPGRKCVYVDISYFGGKKEIIKGTGHCKPNAEADRIVAKGNQIRAETNQQHRDFIQQQQHRELMDKLDELKPSSVSP